MSFYQSRKASQQAEQQAEAVRAAHAGGDSEQFFDLRDTLRGISVRDANFSEFLAALKRAGKHSGK